MGEKYKQMSLLDTYKSVEEQLENNKPELFLLLEEHLDWEEIIPARFYNAFYRRLGRKRGYGLESFLRALFLQRIFHYVEDSQLLNTLRFSCEMRDYCGFEKVPDASKLTRFKQDFCEYIRDVFERLVDMTEPICKEMDKALADMLVFDTTGIESCVAENNPKFAQAKARQAVAYSKIDPTFDPDIGRTAFMPGYAASNPAVKHQYINVSAPVRFCNFSPKTECKKMAGKGVQPLNDYTCRFRPSSLKCTDKSGLDGLQADKWSGNQGCIHLYAARRKMAFYFSEKLHF